MRKKAKRSRSPSSSSSSGEDSPRAPPKKKSSKIFKKNEKAEPDKTTDEKKVPPSKLEEDVEDKNQDKEQAIEERHPDYTLMNSTTLPVADPISDTDFTLEIDARDTLDLSDISDNDQFSRVVKLVENRGEMTKDTINPPVSEVPNDSTNNEQDDDQLVQEARMYVRQAAQARQVNEAERLRSPFRVAPPRNMPGPGYTGQAAFSNINPNAPSTSRGIYNRNPPPRYDYNFGTRLGRGNQRIGINHNQPERSVYDRIGRRGREDYPSYYYDDRNYSNYDYNNIIDGGRNERYFQQLDRDSQLTMEYNRSAEEYPEYYNDEEWDYNY